MWYRRYGQLKYQLMRLHVIFLGCIEHVAEGASLRGGADDVFHFI
jgi:hypothetical protein